MFALLRPLFTVAATLAAAYSPATLDTVANRVDAAVERGETPIVIFDIDDTLVDTRPRMLTIFREYGLSNVRLGDVRYHAEDTLRDIGIEDAATVSEVKEFFNQRYYSNDYLDQDRPISGARAYVHKLADRGAHIIYMTGRDVPRMGSGTWKTLKEFGFPIGKTNIELFMKPTKDMDDLEYKKQALKDVAAYGETVVGVFENEPRNLNAMHDAFPGATAVFLDTMHSNRPIEPTDAAKWVRDFHRRHGNDGTVAKTQ